MRGIPGAIAWRVPPVFSGGTVVVIASGPSLTAEDVAKVRAADLPTIVVNDVFLLAPWAWLLYAADWRWWKKRPAALNFAGIKASVEGFYPGIVRLRNTGIDGFDPDPSCIRTGNNSGYQAVHIAIHTGAARIVLLGFDMRGGHFNGRPDGAVRRDWIARFCDLADVIEDRVDIVNATPDSALRCFRFMRLDDAIKQERVE